MLRARKIHRKIPPARCPQLPESSPRSAIPRIAAFLQLCREIPPALHARPETWKQFLPAAPHPTPCATTRSAARSSHPAHIRSWLQSLSSRIPRTVPKIPALDASVPPRLPHAVSPLNSEFRRLYVQSLHKSRREFLIRILPRGSPHESNAYVRLQIRAAPPARPHLIFLLFCFLEVF